MKFLSTARDFVYAVRLLVAILGDMELVGPCAGWSEDQELHANAACDPQPPGLTVSHTRSTFCSLLKTLRVKSEQFVNPA